MKKKVILDPHTFYFVIIGMICELIIMNLSFVWFGASFDGYIGYIVMLNLLWLFAALCCILAKPKWGECVVITKEAVIHKSYKTKYAVYFPHSYEISYTHYKYAYYGHQYIDRILFIPIKRYRRYIIVSSSKINPTYLRNAKQIPLTRDTIVMRYSPKTEKILYNLLPDLLINQLLSQKKKAETYQI